MIPAMPGLAFDSSRVRRFDRALGFGFGLALAFAFDLALAAGA